MRLLSIQYLRGFSAVSIVFYHAFVQLDRLGFSGPTPQILSGGVDIFFVISGFIIWHTTSLKHIDALTFVKNRVRRIVPLYWIVTTFYLAVVIFAPHLMQSGHFDLYHVAASYLFIPTPHPSNPTMMWPLVVQGWSLNCEMFFYVLFGISLLLSRKVRLIAIETCIIALIMLHYILSLPENSIIGFYSSSVMIEFAFGVALSYLTSMIRPINVYVVLLTMIAGLCGLVMVAVFDLLPNMRGVAYGIPCSLMVGGAVLYEKSFSIPRLAPLKLIGDSSYSLYLIHGSVLSALGRLALHLTVLTSLGMACFLLVGVSCAILAGLIVFQYIERPVLFALSSRGATNSKNTKLAAP